jgi:hypothetical protein
MLLRISNGCDDWQDGQSITFSGCSYSNSRNENPHPLWKPQRLFEAYPAA